MKTKALQKKFAISLLSLTSLTTLVAQADNAAQIQVTAPFVRELPPTAMATAAFMTLKNQSQQDIYLTRASSTAAKIVELHTHIKENGMMKMRQVAHIKIPAKGEAHLKPGGYHIMLINPIIPLKQGEKVKLTLTFQDGSHKTLFAPVQPLMMHKKHSQIHDH